MARQLKAYDFLRNATVRAFVVNETPGSKREVRLEDVGTEIDRMGGPGAYDRLRTAAGAGRENAA